MEIKIPEGHRIININISRECGKCIDKDEALAIIITNHGTEIASIIKYRGATSKYHVFSHPISK